MARAHVTKIDNYEPEYILRRGSEELGKVHVSCTGSTYWVLWERGPDGHEYDHWYLERTRRHYVADDGYISAGHAGEAIAALKKAAFRRLRGKVWRRERKALVREARKARQATARARGAHDACSIRALDAIYEE